MTVSGSSTPQRRDSPSSHDERPAIHDLLLVMAALLFGLAVRPGAVSGVTVFAAVAALGAVVHIDKRRATFEVGVNRPLDTRILMAVGLFGVLGLVGWVPSSIGPTTAALEYLPGGIFLLLAVGAFVTRRFEGALRFGIVAGACLVSVASFGVLHIESTGEVGFDVYWLHVGAADAISQGESPYTDSVTVEDGSPNAEPGDEITGYVYPPITAIAYALGHWATPDARYASLAAWLVVLALVGFTSVRRRSNRHLYVMLLLASVPGLWLVFRAAWTEPLSVMLMAIAVAGWVRPGVSGIGLGAMISSKQYFLVTAPVLMFHRDVHWRRRLAYTALVLVVSIGPFVLWNAEAFWDSAVVFHMTTEPRVDSSNLVGILAAIGFDWAPPAPLPLGIGLVAATWAGWGSRSPRSLTLAFALGLAASFLVSSQAFANYWFMVFGLCALALIAPNEAEGPLA